MKPPLSVSLEIDVVAVRELLAQPADLMLLDCREPDERRTASIDGSHWIPMASIPARLSELEPYRDKRLIVHCHHGSRSLQVTRWLRSNGFPCAQNMVGGIDAWSLQIDPSVQRYG